MPYRTTARTEVTREKVARVTLVVAYACSVILAAAAIANIVAMRSFNGHELAVAWWSSRVVAYGLPPVIAVLAFSAARHLRAVRWCSAAFVVFSIVALVGERFVTLPDSHPRACAGTRIAYAVGPVIFVSVMRALAAIALPLVPLLLTSRRVVPRWPTFTALALAGTQALEHLHYTFTTRNEPWFHSQYPTDPPTAAWLLVVAAAFATSARAATRESITEIAARYPSSASSLFASARDRLAARGPLFLATDLVAALAAVVLVDSMATVAYSTVPTLTAYMGWSSVAIIAALVVALARLKRASTNGSHAPTVAALAATAFAVFAAKDGSALFGDVALIVVSAGIIGLIVTAPPVADGARTTMRRWAKATVTAGLALGFAGFLTLASAACGERGAVRLAKVAAFVLAVVAASASARLSQAARIELAAEEREP